MDEALSINIMYYAAGANMTFLTMMSAYFLRTAGKNKRLRVVTGYVLLLWAIQSYKDAFMLLGGYYECDYLRKLFIMFDTYMENSRHTHSTIPASGYSIYFHKRRKVIHNQHMVFCHIRTMRHDIFSGVHTYLPQTHEGNIFLQ